MMRMNLIKRMNLMTMRNLIKRMMMKISIVWWISFPNEQQAITGSKTKTKKKKKILGHISKYTIPNFFLGLFGKGKKKMTTMFH